MRLPACGLMMECPQCRHPLAVPYPFTWAVAGHILGCDGCGRDWDVCATDGGRGELLFTLRPHEKRAKR